MSLFKYDSTKKLVELDTKNYLRTELGVELKKIQDKNTIEAIATPGTFIANRSIAIEKMFDGSPGSVNKYFDDRLAEYNLLGLPADVAKEMAMRSANRLYQEKLEILELHHPGGYARAFGTASVAHNAKIENNDIAGMGNLGKTESVAEYKIRKKAKKANKRAKRENAGF